MRRKLSRDILEALTQFPKDIQDIIFDDVITAFENRVKTFQHILSKTRGPEPFG